MAVPTAQAQARGQSVSRRRRRGDVPGGVAELDAPLAVGLDVDVVRDDVDVLAVLLADEIGEHSPDDGRHAAEGRAAVSTRGRGRGGAGRDTRLETMITGMSFALAHL